MYEGVVDDTALRIRGSAGWGRAASGEACEYALAEGWTAKTAHTEKLRLMGSLDGRMPPVMAFNSFMAATDFSKLRLSPDACQIRDIANAGGASEMSEAASYEVLRRMFGAKLVKTEMQLRYMYRSCKRTDYSVSVYGHVVGVSVTRAMKYCGVFTVDDARHLLEKKLFGVNASTQYVIEPDSWRKQILHVWAQQPYVAQRLAEAYETLPDELKSDTTVLVTVVPRGKQWMFWNRDVADEWVRKVQPALALFREDEESSSFMLSAMCGRRDDRCKCTC